MQELSIPALQKAVEAKTLIIDARPTAQFVDGFIQGAVNIVLNENFEARADFFSKNEEKVIVVCRPEDKEKLKELTGDFSNKISAYHMGSFADWHDANIPIDLIINVDPYELRLDIKHDDKAIVIDVRPQIQYDAEHIVGATNMPVTDFADAAKIGMLDDKHNLYLHCNGGTASVLISSVLKRNGFHNIRNVEGGLRAVVTDGNIPLHVQNKKSQN